MAILFYIERTESQVSPTPFEVIERVSHTARL